MAFSFFRGPVYGPSMALVGGGFDIAKGITSAFGIDQSQEAKATNARVQAQIALNNAITEDRNAEWATGMGEYAGAKAGLTTAAAVGSVRGKQGASGVDVNTGSNANTQGAVEAAGMENQKVVQSDAARQVYGYQVKASNARNQASLDELQAQQAEDAKGLMEMGSLLDAGSSAAGKFGKYQFG